MILIIAVCLLPLVASASLPVNESSPVWSDTLGNYEVFVACPDDGERVLAGSDTGILRMYDRKGAILWTYRTNGSSVSSLSISGDGNVIAASTNGEILLFNADGDLIRNYTTGTTVNRVAVSGNGATILASAGNVLYTFDSSGNLLGSNTVRGAIWNVALSEDGNYGAAAVDLGWRTRTGSFVITDRSGAAVFDYPAMKQSVDVALSGDGNTIAGVDRNDLYVFFRDGTLRWSLADSPPFRSVAMTPDGSYVAAGSQYYTRFFDQFGMLLWTHEENGYVNSVSVSGDGEYIIAGSGSQVLLFDKAGRVIWRYGEGAAHVAAAKNGKYFATGTANGIRFFNRDGTATVPDLPVSGPGPGFTLATPTPENPESLSRVSGWMEMMAGKEVSIAEWLEAVRPGYPASLPAEKQVRYNSLTVTVPDLSLGSGSMTFGLRAVSVAAIAVPSPCPVPSLSESSGVAGSSGQCTIDPSTGAMIAPLADAGLSTGEFLELACPGYVASLSECHRQALYNESLRVLADSFTAQPSAGALLPGPRIAFGGAVISLPDVLLFGGGVILLICAAGYGMYRVWRRRGNT